MRNKNTLFIGKVLLRFPSLESTNQYASELLAQSKPIEGTAVLTYHQTAGKGQIGSRWESEPHKNIAYSLILYPSFLAVRRQFLLNQAMTLGVADFIANYAGIEVKVKWPNDLYAGSRKTSGILIQNTLTANSFQASIVGIGVNVNQQQFPAHLPNPTSLALESGRTFDLEEAVHALNYYLEVRYLQLKQGKIDQLQSDYFLRLYRLHETIRFEVPGGEPFTGCIVGVAESGKLLVDSDRGREAFGLKEILYR